MEELREWLASLGLEQYYAVLSDNDVDLEVIAELSESELQELGFSLGHRKKILKAASKLSQVVREEQQDQRHSAAALTGEYRYLTVLFCDLVDSTSLVASLGAERMREVNQAYHEACRNVIESYEGYIAKYMGDGVLAYFGFPVSQEDSAERSILASLDLVEKIQQLFSELDQFKDIPLAVRVGLATGRVVIDHIGTGESAESNAVGDAVNLASRLQTIAQPNQVVADNNTRAMAGAGFDYTDLGERGFKGVSEPTQVWGVTGLRSVESRFAAGRGARLGQFVGRTKELGIIGDSWDKTLGGEGQVVVVQSEPGMGKSRLGEEVKRKLAVQGHESIVFQCSPYHQNIAYYPLTKGLKFWLGVDAENTNEFNLDAIARWVRISELDQEETVPLIAEFVGIKSDDRYKLPDLSPQKFREATLNAVNTLLMRYAEHTPVLYFSKTCTGSIRPQKIGFR